MLDELPLGTRPGRLHLQVRRFRCVNPACPRWAAARARRTQAQRDALVDSGLALGGSAGARLAHRRGGRDRRATVVRCLPAPPPLEIAPPRALGIDDWARRKGQPYGSLLVDRQPHRPIALLDDRPAARVAAWLAAHPGVELIARDRGGADAEGARTGAPAAVQVADRFHVLLKPWSGSWGASADCRGTRPGRSMPPSSPPHSRPLPAHRCPPRHGGSPGRSGSHTRDDAVVPLHPQGGPASQIARAVGSGRTTVQRWLHAGSFPERAPAPRRPARLDPYAPCLRERWAAGGHPARQWWREIHAQGGRGAASLVRRFVARWRPAHAWSPGNTAPPPRPTRVRSPRQARCLLLRPVEDLEPAEQAYRQHLLAADADLEWARCLTEVGGQIARERRRDGLEPWLAWAAGSRVPEFRAVARVMRRDYAAVAAALPLAGSSGQTDGQITRLKFVTRQMDGRAGFALLKPRGLRAA